MAECSAPPQSTRKDALGTFYPSPETVDSPTPSSAPLSRCTLLRHPSFVRAVCVDALVRICAGGDKQWSSLPRQLRPMDVVELEGSCRAKRKRALRGRNHAEG